MSTTSPALRSFGLHRRRRGQPHLLGVEPGLHLLHHLRHAPNPAEAPTARPVTDSMWTAAAGSGETHEVRPACRSAASRPGSGRAEPLVWPGLRSELIEGVGHFMMVERPTEINKWILGFLDGGAWRICGPPARARRRRRSARADHVVPGPSGMTAGMTGRVCPGRRVLLMVGVVPLVQAERREHPHGGDLSKRG
jgi:hypothetical protein